jgi:hypothetical protein
VRQAPAALPGTAPGADLHPMTSAAGAAGIPTPRHRAPEEAPPAPRDDRRRRGRHAAPEDDDLPAAEEDPLAWLGFRFEPA